MEAQGRRAVSRIIDILRKTTRLVQLLPFAYLVVYAAVLLTEPLIPDGLYCFIDALLNEPPAVVLLFLVLSHLLKLCKWHKIACLIPMLSRVVNAFDGFVITLTQSEVITINSTLGIITILFILIAHNRIFYGRERVAQGNA